MIAERPQLLPTLVHSKSCARPNLLYKRATPPHVSRMKICCASVSFVIQCPRIARAEDVREWRARLTQAVGPPSDVAGRNRLLRRVKRDEQHYETENQS